MPRYIFLHQVKTGGKTLEKFLLRRFGERFRKTTNLFPQESINNIFDILKTNDLDKLRELEDSDVISGHFPFGLHSLMHGESRYFTLLRDPADRIRSYYAYSLTNEGSAAQRYLLDNQISFEDFVFLSAEQVKASGVHEFNYVIENGQAKIIAGVDDLAGESRYSHDQLMAMATRNIDDHFDYVGVTERFTASFMRICEVMGLGWLNVYITYNKSAMAIDIPAELRSKIYARNSVDVFLHRKYLSVPESDLGIWFRLSERLVRTGSYLAGLYAMVRTR